MSSPTTNVFVSYSHADAFLVAPVVALLRVNASFVFQDITDIKPGKKWRREIDDALNKADLVVVFWCDHANKSDYVKIEWLSAVNQEKDLLPLLLDNTPLPPELAQYQWIDFQKMVGANHSVFSPSPSKFTVQARQKQYIPSGGVEERIARAVEWEILRRQIP